MYMSVRTNCLVEIFRELDLFEKKVLNLVTQHTEDIDDFISSITNVADYGCGSGCASAFIYTSDNKAFFKENLDSILEVLEDIEYVNWMKRDEVLNVDYMVWACVEDVCRKFVDRYTELYEEKLGDE